MTAKRLYRLDVDYPPEAHYAIGDEQYLDPDWEPTDWYKMIPDGWHGDAFAWPKEKLYFSRSGAEVRAQLFRRYGATVTIEASDPITWGGAK